MKQDADSFFQLLSQGRGKRRQFEKINEAHLNLFPQYRNNPEQRSHLWKLLEHLASKDLVTLPSKKGKSWRTGNPSLPDWVSIGTDSKKGSSIIPETYAWHPKVASFIDELIFSQRETAYLISEYLKQHPSKGDFEISIPRRERSLKIFGDEKKLDQLSKKGLLLSGNLSLSDLGCHDVGWPMPHQLPRVPCPGKPFLIIENHHTYDSFCRWNDDVGAYAGIGYGAGDAFSTVETDHIETIISPTKASEIHYFGDIDPKGISIPTRVSEARVEKNLLPILPAVHLYQWLLDNGTQRDLSKKRLPRTTEKWLPEKLDNHIKVLFSKQKWIPQEALGYEELSCEVFDAF